MQYSYSEKLLTGKAKPIQITGGDPDNQHPNKWSSTVVQYYYKFCL